MTRSRSRPALGAILFFALAFLPGAYFTFAAVEGDHGIFRRVQIDAEADTLRAEKKRLTAELARIKNKTHRLSDDYLDLDLLDQQARDILGMVRADEIVIR